MGISVGFWDEIGCNFWAMGLGEKVEGRLSLVLVSAPSSATIVGSVIGFEGIICMIGSMGVILGEGNGPRVKVFEFLDIGLACKRVGY